jgi:glycosyltransferase involved in cell wall biosynthesis
MPLNAWLRSQTIAAGDIPGEGAFAELAAGPSPRSPASGSPAVRPAGRVRVLMPICQKIGATGSGIVVREVVERAAARGLALEVVCGADGEDESEAAAPSSVQVRRVMFGRHDGRGLPFPIVGMSDRMPYPSSRFSDLTFDQLSAYLDAWRSQIQECIGAFRPALIHVHHLWLLSAVCAAAGRDIPLVVSVHGTDLQQAVRCEHLRELVAPWVRSVSLFISLSDGAVDETRRLYPDAPDCFVTLGNGFNEALFHPVASPSAAIAARYGVTDWETRPLVLFVGKFVEWKGIEWLIRSFGDVVHDRHADALLVIAGTGPDVERRRYERVAHDLGLQDRIRFTGEIRYEDVGVLMSMATVFVLPSLHEPFGLVLLEALACGTRVVAANQGGPPSFVPQALKDTRDAILVPGLPSSPPSVPEAARFVRDLADAIVEQLSRPLSFDQRLAIARAVRHLTWDAYVDKLLQAYQRVLAG